MRRPLAALALLAAIPAAGAEDIVILSTRAGVTQAYLLTSPPADKARAVAILFPGGAGKVNLEREAGRAVLERGNFLVRTRRAFAGAGIVAAVVDSPSDQARGMLNSFRKGDAHAADIRAVVTDLKKRFGGLPVFLLGTSMGSVSAAYVGQALGSEVDGVALTSSPFRASGRRSKHGDNNLSDFNLAGIRTDLLIVHHSEDGCAICPYDEARRRAGSIPLVSVSGGKPAESDPCEAMSPHGFLGREADTVDAIAKWMRKQPYPREIN